MSMAEADLRARDTASGELIDYGTQAGPSHRLHLPYAATQHICAAIDANIIILSSIIGGMAYHQFYLGGLGDIQAFAAAGITAAILYVSSARALGHYQPGLLESTPRIYRNIITHWVVVSLVLTLLAFLMKVGASYSRGSVVSFAALALTLLLGARFLERRFFATAAADGLIQGSRVVLIGSRQELSTLNERDLLQRFGLTEIKRVVYASDRGNNFSMSDHERASIDQALAIARDFNAERIVLALPWSESRKLELIRDKLRACPLPVQLLPDSRVRSITENPSFSVRDALSIEIQRGPLSSFEQLSKRILDLVGASIALLMLFPIMAVAAICIKLDSPGPVFFRQRRNGFNAKPFRIFKFRSMTVLEDGDCVVQATRKDPRVTRVGRILRQSSIDELPQLFNVLRGDMSLVGPRPHALAHDSYYGDLLAEYAFRHHVKPGITGWAQIHGYRGETSSVDHMKGRIDFDLWYINNWSLALDLRIIVVTAFEVVRHRNAH